MSRVRRSKVRSTPGVVTRGVTFVLLLAGGLTLALYAARLLAAASGWSFSPFSHLGLPEDHGWQAISFVALIAVCVVLLDVLLRDSRDELLLTGPDGGVLVSSDAIEPLLRDAALAHAEVVTADIGVRVRGGRPAASLAVTLRPLVDGKKVAAELTVVSRQLLVRVTGRAEVDVRVRQRVLTVKQLAGRLP